MSHREHREKEKIVGAREVPSFSLIALRAKKKWRTENTEKKR
jgi:hypothetical protein